MPKDKKAKQAEKKARVAEKTHKKAAQKEKKGKTKGRRPDDDSDAEDIDLDAVLEEYARQVSLVSCSQSAGLARGCFVNDRLAASPVPQVYCSRFRPAASAFVCYLGWVAVLQH